MAYGITTNYRNAMHRLDKVADALSAQGLKELGKDADNQLTKSMASAFVTSSAPSTGKPWARRNESHPHPILRKSGELAASVNARTFLMNRGKTLVIVGGVIAPTKTEAIKAGVAQYGRGLPGNKSGSRWRPMPARPFVGFTPQAEAGVVSKAKAILHRGAVS